MLDFWIAESAKYPSFMLEVVPSPERTGGRNDRRGPLFQKKGKKEPEIEKGSLDSLSMILVLPPKIAIIRSSNELP